MSDDPFANIPVLDESGQAVEASNPVPVTTYSIPKQAGGADEMYDPNTARGIGSSDNELTPGVVAVNPSRYAIGTIFKNPETNQVFIAGDKHGNKNPDLIDIYRPPSQYNAQSGQLNMVPIGQIPANQVPKTAAGVRDLLSAYGKVPEGESAYESLSKGSASSDPFANIPVLGEETTQQQAQPQDQGQDPFANIPVISQPAPQATPQFQPATATPPTEPPSEASKIRGALISPLGYIGQEGWNAIAGIQRSLGFNDAANKSAETAANSVQDWADLVGGVAPAPGSIAEKAGQIGGAAVSFPALVGTGMAGMGTILAQAFGGAKEDLYDKYKQQGLSDQEANQKSTTHAAISTIAALPAYWLGGKAAGAIADRVIAESTPKLVDAVSRFGFNTVANSVGSAITRGISAGLEGEDPVKAAKDLSLGGVFQDMLFAGHSVGEHFKEQAQKGNLDEDIKQASPDVLNVLSKSPVTADVATSELERRQENQPVVMNPSSNPQVNLKEQQIIDNADKQMSAPPPAEQPTTTIPAATPEELTQAKLKELLFQQAEHDEGTDKYNEYQAQIDALKQPTEVSPAEEKTAEAPVAEAPTEETTNAVQEPSAREVGVRNAPAVGEGVGAENKPEEVAQQGEVPKEEVAPKAEQPNPKEILQQQELPFSDLEGLPSKEQQAANIKARQAKQGGFVDTSILSDAFKYGARIYQKGMQFAEWAAKMVKDLGSAIADHLSNIWNGLKQWNARMGERGSLGSSADEFAAKLEAKKKAEAKPVGEQVTEKSAEDAYKERLSNYWQKTFNRPITEQEINEALARKQPKVEATSFSEQPRVTSIQNVVTAGERQARGIPAMEKEASKSFGTAWDEAMSKMKDNPLYQSNLIDELEKKPRSLTDVEDATLLHRQITLQNEYEKALSEHQKLSDKPEKTIDEVGKMQEERIKIAALQDELKRLYDIEQSAGTESGRGLNARKMLRANDYSLGTMTSKFVSAKGEGLTVDEAKDIKKTADELKDLDKKENDLEEKAKNKKTKEANDAADEKIKDLKSKAKKTKVEPSTNEAQQEQIINTLNERKKAGDDLASSKKGIDALALTFIRSGITERESLIDAVHNVLKDIFPDITRDDTRDAMSGYGKFTPETQNPIKKLYSQLKGEMLNVSKIEGMLKGEAPKATGKGRVSPSDENRRLTKIVNEMKKLGGFLVADPARELKSSMDSIKTRLNNQIRDLEYALANKTPLVSKDGKIEYDAEAKQLKARRDELKQQYDDIFQKPGLTDEQRLNMAMKSTERSIDYWKNRIEQAKRGIFDPIRNETIKVSSKELEAMKAQQTALKEEFQHLKELAKPRKSPAQIEIERLQSRLDDANDRIANGEKKAPTPEKEPLTEYARRLQEDLDRAKQQFKDLFKSPPKTEEEKQVDSLNDQIKNLNEKISSEDYSSNPKKYTADTKQVSELKAERDRLRKIIQDKRNEGIIKKTPEEVALQGAKTRILNRIAELESKMASGDLSKTPRKEIVPDKELLDIKARKREVQENFDRKVEEQRLKNRSIPEKMMDTFQKWRRGFLLSSPLTLAKLTAAAVERVAITPIEEAIGGIYSQLPILSRVAEGAPREGGFNIKAEAKAFAEAITTGMKDASETITKGKSQLDYLYGKRDPMPKEMIDFFGNLHGMLKAPVKRAEFTRSLEKRLAHQMAIDPASATDPAIQTKIMIEAYKDANRSIFMQDNRVVSAYRRAIGALEQPEKTTGKVPLGAKALATTAKVLLPIVKVPTNLVAETFQYATGLITGSARLASALRQGIENVPPEGKDLIMRDLKKGTLGAAMLLIGYYNASQIGGYYQQGVRRKEGDTKYGSLKVFGMNVPSFLLHNPLLECLQIGATVRRIADSKLRKSDKETQGVSNGIIGAGIGLLTEVPFVEQTTQANKLLNANERGNYINELGKSILIPQAVDFAARQMDKNAQGEVIQRKPQGFEQTLETGIPGLRQNVPERKQTTTRSSSSGGFGGRNTGFGSL